MPAKSSSPATSAASFAVGSSTTTTMNRSSRGGPPSASGKSGLAANTQRRGAPVGAETNGPLPGGAAHPPPLAREIRPRRQRGIVARQRGEQSELLHLSGELVLPDQRVDALQVGAGSEQHRRAATGGAGYPAAPSPSPQPRERE